MAHERESFAMRRLLRGEALRPFVPQSTFLSLITTGERYAIGTKGPFCLEVGRPCAILPFCSKPLPCTARSRYMAAKALCEAFGLSCCYIVLSW